MEKLPARVGWSWVKQGFVLFRRQPAELSTLFISYMFLMLGIGYIPLFGQLLPLVLLPVFSMAFMQACVHVEQGKRVYPSLLLTGFRSPAFVTLLKLGVLYLVVALFAIAVSSIVDGGLFWKAVSGQVELDEKMIQGSSISLAMLTAAAIYTSVTIAFWYAAPLIAWNNMSLGKSIFYSVFSVRRASRAFLVYGLAWAVINLLIPTLISVIVILVMGKMIATILLLPLSMVLTVIMYCSFYPTYTSIFSQPETPSVSSSIS